MKDWSTVTRSKPCPVCGKHDWCAIRKDGSAAACTRIEEGCARHRDGSSIEFEHGMGWVHRLGQQDTAYARVKAALGVAPDTAPPARNWRGFAAEAMQSLAWGKCEALAEELGVTPLTLGKLWVGWSHEHKAFTFPMQNADADFVGVRLRYPDGRKLSVRGGKEGIFSLTWTGCAGPLVVCEGASDAAAVHDWGFASLGRPSCRGAVDIIVDVARRCRREVWIVSDVEGRRELPNGSVLPDGPGVDGAVRLANLLSEFTPTKILVPGWSKDVREAKAAGWTRERLERMAQTQKFWTPQ